MFYTKVDILNFLSLRYLNCSHCELVLRNITSSEKSLIPAKYRASGLGLSLQYTAYADYYGEDQLGIVAQDSSGAYSLAYVFSISIRFRPCLHNSTCKVRVEIRETQAIN